MYAFSSSPILYISSAFWRTALVEFKSLVIESNQVLRIFCVPSELFSSHTYINTYCFTGFVFIFWFNSVSLLISSRELDVSGFFILPGNFSLLNSKFSFSLRLHMHLFHWITSNCFYSPDYIVSHLRYFFSIKWKQTKKSFNVKKIVYLFCQWLIKLLVVFYRYCPTWRFTSNP